jgi:small subunit ribosomal protein S20
MPQHKSCWKRMRTNERQRSRNRAARSEVRVTVRACRETAAADQVKVIPTTTSAIDNAVRLGVLKKATANRMKSRLARAANKAQKAGQ